jgi:hypothetical protein
MNKLYHFLTLSAVLSVSAQTDFGPSGSAKRLATVVENWLSGRRIQEITAAVRVPQGMRLGGGEVFTVDDIEFGSQELVVLSRAITSIGDWQSAKVWEELLDSKRTHVRYIACECLRCIHNAELTVPPINCYGDPETERAKAERRVFLTRLGEARQRLEATIKKKQ